MRSEAAVHAKPEFFTSWHLFRLQEDGFDSRSGKICGCACGALACTLFLLLCCSHRRRHLRRYSTSHPSTSIRRVLPIQFGKRKLTPTSNCGQGYSLCCLFYTLQSAVHECAHHRYQDAGGQPSSGMSFDFRVKLFAIFASGNLVVLAWETIVVQGPVRSMLRRRFPPRSVTHPLRL